LVLVKTDIKEIIKLGEIRLERFYCMGEVEQLVAEEDFRLTGSGKS
jgi:hypothetical protein